MSGIFDQIINYTPPGNPFSAGNGLTLTGSVFSLTAPVSFANGGTNSTSAPQSVARSMGFTSTVTAAGTTTLTNTSTSYQLFTGATTQTVTLPVTSTLETGWVFHIINNSTGVVTVNSSGSNLVVSLPAGVTAFCTCIGTTLTTAADWEAGFTDFSTLTGTGSVVLSASPTFSGTIAGTYTLGGAPTITPTVRSSGATPYLTITTPADTNRTASTESIGLSLTAATRQWATGALTLQRERVFAAPTYSFVGASTLTTAINVDIADPIQGTNATLTNIFGLRFNRGQFTNQLVSTVATGTAPLVVASTTNIPNLNASSLNGATFAAPGAIGSGTASTGVFTALTAPSLTSAAASNLTLGTGTFGTALTFMSATGAATFASISTFQSGALFSSAVAAIDTASSGSLGLKIGVLTSSPSNSTDAFVGVQNTGGPGALAGDLLYIARSSVAASHRWFTGNGGAIASRMVLNNAGDLSLSSTTASTSTTTGSLINAGGFGNAGAIFGGSNLDINNNAIIGVRSASSGGGGQLRIRDDTGTIRWTVGVLGTAANTTFSIYDSVNAVSMFDMTSGTLATYGAIFRGTKAATLSTNGVLTVGDGSTAATNVSIGGGNIFAGNQIRSTSATGGIGYATGAGGAVTQGTSRTTGVTLNNVCGAITLFTAAGSATATSFTVTNSTVAATDTIILSVRSATNKYLSFVTAVAAGSFEITFYTTGGVSSDAPVINFALIDAVAA